MSIRRSLQVYSLLTALLLTVDSFMFSIHMYSPLIASMFTVDGSFANLDSCSVSERAVMSAR